MKFHGFYSCKFFYNLLMILRHYNQRVEFKIRRLKAKMSELATLSLRLAILPKIEIWQMI